MAAHYHSSDVNVNLMIVEQKGDDVVVTRDFLLDDRNNERYLESLLNKTIDERKLYLNDTILERNLTSKKYTCSFDKVEKLIGHNVSDLPSLEKLLIANQKIKLYRSELDRVRSSKNARQDEFVRNPDETSCCCGCCCYCGSRDSLSLF